MKTHKEEYTARYHEMGIDRHMRVQCLCNYMEEAAGIHAMLLGAGMDRLGSEGIAWVLTKLRLCLLNDLPKAGEQFFVETWPVKIERVQFRRDFEVTDGGGRLLATAVTQWVVMGLRTRRVERFPSYITDMQPEHPKLAQAEGDIRIPSLREDSRQGPSFPVRLADIDQNQHVNNGRYIDFALEAAHVAGMRGTLRQLELIFRAEGLRGDIIGSKTLVEEDSGDRMSSIHSLYREGDGQELARVRTVWDS